MLKAELIRSKFPLSANIQREAIKIGGKDTVLQEKSVDPKTYSQEVTADEGYDGLSKLSVSAVTSNIDANITPTNIRAGVSILGVQGNLSSDKPDQTKRVTPKTTEQSVFADAGYELGEVIVEAVTSDIDSDIKASNIKRGINILGVDGTFDGGELQSKTVTPTTSEQNVTADTGFYGLSGVKVNAVNPSDYYKDEEIVNVTPSTESQKITPTANKVFNEVNVSAVTSAIDTNIVAGNIKKDVTILGVTGTLEEGGAEDLTEELTAQDEQIERLTIAIDELPTPKCSCGDIGSGNYYLKVIDYDGTVLDEKRLNTGDTYTLPSAPSHEGLIFREWSCSQEIVDGVITIADNNVMVGATYDTASGLSEFDIILTKNTGLNVTLNMNGTKNWGDGTSDTLTTHTYVSYGDYTITCDGTTMTTSSSSGLFGQSNTHCYCIGARFGAGVTTVRSGAFNYCVSLKSVVIPRDVTDIGSQCFSYCYSLTGIVIPRRVGSIGDILTSCRALTNVVIPRGVTSINKPFSGCSSLTGVVIPKGVSFIGNYSFNNCSSLTCMIIPQGVTSIGSGTFGYCSSLNKVIIPSGVTSIGQYLFTECKALTNIEIPQGVTSIGGDAFYNCYSLANVTIPPSVTSIGGSAFSNCSSLTSIIIPSGVTNIGSSAFGYCSSIIKYDFTQCTTIVSLVSTYTLNGINAICKIYVPDALYDEWIVATNWATYADYIYKASEMEA